MARYRHHDRPVSRRTKGRLNERCLNKRRRDFRADLAGLVLAVALASTGCSLFLIDSACRGYVIEDPLLRIHFVVWTHPPPSDPVAPRRGVVSPRPQALHLHVGRQGEAMMTHQPENRQQVRGRCGPLAANDLAEVTRAVERLENSVVAKRKVRHPGCRQGTTIVLRGDYLLKTFDYCGTTPPAEIVRFVEEISVPLGRRFGRELATGLAATAPWAPPVPLEQSGD